MIKNHNYLSLLFVFMIACTLPLSLMGAESLADKCVFISAQSLPHAQKTEAQKILKTSGIEGGLIVQLNCGDGRLTAALYTNNRYLVRGLTDNRENVVKARDYIRSLGFYGKVSVQFSDGGHLPFVDNLANLIVSESEPGVAEEEIMRVLAPMGVYLVKKDGKWIKKIKPWPREIDEWTHYFHGPDNNAVAMDTRVGPPGHIHWKAKPLWCRSHEFASSVHVLVSAKGRLFGIIDKGITGQPRGVPTVWTLVARDAFNGILLWERPCAMINRHALAAVGNRVYVTLSKQGPLSILNGATGEIIKTCKETGKVSEILCCEGILVLNAKIKNKKNRNRFAQYVVAANADNGHILWKKKAKAVGKYTLIAGNGRACFYNGEDLVCLNLQTGKDLWHTATASGHGRYAVMYKGVVFLTGGGINAFSLATGKLLWTGPRASSFAAEPPGLFGAEGLIWPAWSSGHSRTFFWKPWEVVRKGYDPVTGKVEKTVVAKRLVTPGHHIRCYPPKATERYLLLNKRGVEFLDLAGKNHMRNNWARGACHFGVLPANGMLYTPPSQCFCYPGVELKGFNALSATIDDGKDFPGKTADAEKGNRLVRGPAWNPAEKGKTGETNGSTYEGQGPADAAKPPDTKGVAYKVGVAGAKSAGGPAYKVGVAKVKSAGGPAYKVGANSADEDWPTYRHDAQRSGSTKSKVPVNLDYLWEINLGGKISPPVAARGKVFVAKPDSHTVYCLDSRNGKILWSYVTDGRIDSPPTIYKNLVLFGSTDGNVYCLRFMDGKLVWRFKAAPIKRQVMVFGQLESAWPVHGSVLVFNKMAYFSAGRSSFLDGGIYVYAADPGTGKILYKTRLESGRPNVSKYAGRPFDMDGARSDIMVAGKKDIYMLLERFHPDLTLQSSPRITKLGDRKVGAHLMSNSGLLDDSWFNRTYWIYGERWPGYYFTFRGPKAGQILVFDDTTTYALRVYTEQHGLSPEFQPGSGYEFYADRNTTKPVLRPTDIGREKGAGFSRTELPKWSVLVPIRARGMVLAGRNLYIAGPPDLAQGQGAFEAMEGLRGSVFRVVSASNGKKLAEFKMKQVPVFDGLIAAGGRLFMSTTKGTLICMGKGGKR